MRVVGSSEISKKISGCNHLIAWQHRYECGSPALEMAHMAMSEEAVSFQRLAIWNDDRAGLKTLFLLCAKLCGHILSKRATAKPYFIPKNK